MRGPSYIKQLSQQ